MKRLGGWWRLWVVCTTIWLIFLVALCVATWPKMTPSLYPSDFGKLTKQSASLLTILPEDLFAPPAPPTYIPPPDEKPWDMYRKAKEKQGRDLGSLLGYTDPIVFIAPDATEYKLPYKTTKEQIEALRIDYIRVQKDKLYTERVTHIFTYIAVWILPSLAMMLLGLAFRWVFKGFKKEPETM